MIKTDFMSLYEELSVLNEAKVDIDNFINKFGEDTYDLFKKSTQRLKNKGISTDLTYHVKHTDKKDLEAILINLQNRAITKDDNLTELAGDYEYLGEGKGYKVYKINDVVASMNLGAGTGWCISGRFGHYGEKNYTPTRSEAEKHWKSYTEKGVQFYFFVGNKNKVALALYPKTFALDKIVDNTFITTTNCEVYDERDSLSYNLLPSLPVGLIGSAVIFEGQPTENGLYIKNNVLIKCDRSLESIVIPDSVTSIGDEAFLNCKSLTSIVIPDSVTAIGPSVFRYCTSLTGVTFGANSKLTTIGDFAFYCCDSLTSIVIPESVTTIGKYAFSNCDSLRSITIPDTVTTIGVRAFSLCTSLTSVTFGENSQLTTIGESAFLYCTSLASITIPASVASIGDGAFIDCDSLTDITVAENNPNYKVVDGHLYDKKDKMIV